MMTAYISVMVARSCPSIIAIGNGYLEARGLRHGHIRFLSDECFLCLLFTSNEAYTMDKLKNMFPVSVVSPGSFGRVAGQSSPFSTLTKRMCLVD